MLRYPVDFVGITQYYSDRHKGIDLGWKDTPNTPGFAAADGVVVDCGTEPVYGAIYAVLRHPRPDGLCYTLYWHLRSLSVSVGQAVRQGEQLGVMGSTGLATGVHLHYETWLSPSDYTAWNLSDRDKYAVDPRSVTYLYPDQQVSPNSKGVLPLPAAESMALIGEPLYASSTSVSPAAIVTGRYWRWDEAVINGRIRITNDPSRIGVAGQVTGWIAPDRRTYTVVRGDTLSGIAAKNGLTLAQVIALNPQIENPNLIYPGQTIYLS